MSVYKYGRTIPEFVKRYRDDMGLTQDDLAHKLKVRYQYVSTIERGVRPAPVGFVARLVDVIKDSDRRQHLVNLLCEAKAEVTSEQFNHNFRSRK